MKPPVQKLNVAALVFYVEESPYLYDSKEPLYNVTRVKYARWEEIGAIFGISGETATRYWAKAVVRYKVVLRKIIADYLVDLKVQAEHPGLWFDVVGKILGVEFSAIEGSIRRDQSLEQNFSRMIRLD